jgi:hypothetical protein
MWERLKPSDIEQAKQVVKGRRAELLRRHREELDSLEVRWSEVGALDRLADAFCRKFKNTVAPSLVSIAAVSAEPEPALPPEDLTSAEPAEPAPALPPADLAPADPASPIKPVARLSPMKPSPVMPPILHSRDKPAREPVGPREKHRGGTTNFDIFSRAISKSTF